MSTSRAAALALLIAATTLAGPEPAGTSLDRVPLPGAPTAATVADVDQDGVPDLIVAVADGPRLVLLRGIGSGRFAARAPIEDLPGANGTRLLALTALDADRDGHADVIGAGSPTTLWMGRGDGRFTPRVLTAAAASHAQSADLDLDGDPDLLLVTAAGLVVLRNDRGEFAPVETWPVEDAWPVQELRVTQTHGQPFVLVHGGPAEGLLVWAAMADCTLAPAMFDGSVGGSPPGLLVRADLDGDGREDEVVAAPDGSASLSIRLTSLPPAVVKQPLVLATGRLRTTGRGVRALVRATLPPDATGYPTRLRLGDPSGPFALALAPGGWSTGNGGVDVWRAPGADARTSIVLDRAHGTVTVRATGLQLPVTPHAGIVQVALDWDGLPTVHQSPWQRNMRGDLVYRLPRAEQPTATAGGDQDRATRAMSRPDSDFTIVTREIDGKTVTLIRRRKSGAMWRLSPSGSWEPAGADGRPVTAAAAQAPEKVTLHFHGPVDGSDEIRIDAAGATWISRHWGLPRGSATLNGVPWTPRANGTLTNSGKTRFLRSGVDFSSARLVSHSGRDLLALDVAAGHVTLKVSDSPNGPGTYDAVIELDAAATAGTPSIDRGLLAHLPLTADTADTVVPGRTVKRGAARLENGAAVFDGKSVIELPHLRLANRPFSFAMHVRVDGDAATMGIVEQRSAHARNRHLHLMVRGRRPYLGFYNNDLIADRDLPRDGRFHHLVFQYTGEEQEIWMDGERIARRRAAPYRGDTGATRLGRNPGWNNVGRSHLVGAMRNVRIYGRALSADEVAELAAERARPAPTARSGATPRVRPRERGTAGGRR